MSILLTEFAKMYLLTLIFAIVYFFDKVIKSDKSAKEKKEMFKNIFVLWLTTPMWIVFAIVWGMGTILYKYIFFPVYNRVCQKP